MVTSQSNGSKIKQLNNVENASNNSSNGKSKMEGFEIADQSKSLKDERKKSENKASKTLICKLIIRFAKFFKSFFIF